MGEVIFARLLEEIFTKMGQGGRQAPMIKRVAGIRQNEKQVTAVAGNPVPFAQGGERIGYMF